MSAIIGITTSSIRNTHGQSVSSLPDAYSKAVQDAGGVPVLIPCSLSDAGWERLYAFLDGILFSGGGDIAVSHYGGEEHRAVDDVEPSRDKLELDLLQAAVADRKPFLGICRGCQLVNVGLGGTLYVHIPDELPGALNHDLAEGQGPRARHDVQVERDTRVARILEEPLVSVNSHHHQGLKEIGRALRVGATASDGLVEAIELPDHPFGVAVQWHPERLRDEPHASKLMAAFIEAASRFQERAAHAGD